MTRFPVRSSATARLLLRGSLLLCAFVAQPALAQVKCGQGVSDAVCPYITSPSVGGFVDERGTLRWHPVKGTAQYRYIIDSDYSAPYIVDATTTRDSVAFRDHWPQIRDLDQVRIRVFAGSVATTWVTFNVRKAPPAAPTLTGPGSSSSAASVPNRRPTFQWQAVSGAQNYAVRVTGANGQMQTYPNVSGTSYQPPQNIPDNLQNPVKWSAAACTQAGGCGRFATDFLINLPGGAMTGPVILSQPATGAPVQGGSTLSWNALPGAGNYAICIKKQSSPPPTSGNIGGCSWNQQNITATGYTMTAANVQNIGAGTAFWTVRACTSGNTACTQNYQWRAINVATGGGTGDDTGGGTTPQVSFAQHLYPTIASNACDACHQSSSRTPPYYPQKPDGAPRNCAASTIPFNTTITAAQMLDRFRCLKARSTQGTYSQALGKVYVVPGSSAQSGLHFKAQASTASAFSTNMTIGGVTKPLKEWIRIWIDQGANP
ncbi:hypothetical protein [Sinimarinibacterium flocculans]|uniref:hypothetical protein n=1 Tax=Sinimarinibacterium flocculans TaxID=985250 RepID=UPI00249065C7|nr:hypothetical protein [Sinimarinibacterium flocculans]